MLGQIIIIIIIIIIILNMGLVIEGRESNDGVTLLVGLVGS